MHAELDAIGDQLDGAYRALCLLIDRVNIAARRRPFNEGRRITGAVRDRILAAMRRDRPDFESLRESFRKAGSPIHAGLTAPISELTHQPLKDI